MSTVEQLTTQVTELEESVKLLQQQVKALEEAKEKEAGAAERKKRVDAFIKRHR